MSSQLVPTRRPYTTREVALGAIEATELELHRFAAIRWSGPTWVLALVLTLVSGLDQSRASTPRRALTEDIRVEMMGLEPRPPACKSDLPFRPLWLRVDVSRHLVLAGHGRRADP